MIKSGRYSTPYLLLFYLLLWVLLFEIILPVNDIFPKPSIVFQSFSDLFKDYQFGWNYVSTISVIYFPLILAYFLAELFFPIILKKTFLSDIILSVEWFSRYIPGIILALILIYWFPQSEFTKFVFAFFISFSPMTFRSKHLAENLGAEYFLAFQSLGLSKKAISRKIIWKAIQPDLVAHIIKQNIYLWASVLIFEYINLGFGLGTILRKILQFKDLSALVLIFILITASIFAGTQTLKLIKSKFYFWKV